MNVYYKFKEFMLDIKSEFITIIIMAVISLLLLIWLIKGI